MNWSFTCLLLFLSFTCFCSRFCFSKYTITSTEFINDPATRLSNASSFELGFFNPVNSTSRYVGIWFNQVSPQTVVWVANRDKPLKDNSGVFTISKDGNLVVLDGMNQTLWSSNVSNPAINTTARILDSGNLVLEDSNGVVIWESFKHPSHTFLPTMKFMTDVRTGENVSLTSWKSPFDPSAGNFSLRLEALNVPEVVIWNGHNPYWRSGPWNGRSFNGILDMNSSYLFGFNLVIQDQQYSLFIANINETARLYYSLNSQGNLEEFYWHYEENDWKINFSALKTPCDFYGACGAFGICNAQTTPVCSCLRGFEAKNPGNWTSINGCVRKTPLQCEKLNNNVGVEQGKEDGFFKMEMVKLPHFAELSILSASADDCRKMCLDNCLCTAYAYENSIGCMFWRGNLTDIQKFDRDGANLYLRLASTEFNTDDVKNNKGIIIASVIPGTLIFIIVIYFFWRWMNGKHGNDPDF